MRHRPAAALLLAALTALCVGSAAGARASHGSGAAVFVQTNELTGNRILVYDRANDGTLAPAGSYATGGLGAAAQPGTETDRLASQGSLVLDRARDLLIAVNAGSNSVSTFKVDGETLSLESVVASGGQFPASI